MEPTTTGATTPTEDTIELMTRLQEAERARDAAVLRADAADANSATLAKALLKVCDAATPHMPQTKIATRTPLADAVGEAIHAIHLDRQHREGRDPLDETRRALQAALARAGSAEAALDRAHDEQRRADASLAAESQPLADALLARGWRGNGSIYAAALEAIVAAEAREKTARAQARKAAASEESLRAAIEEALTGDDDGLADRVRALLDGEEVSDASLELLERFRALGQQVEDLTGRAVVAEGRAVAAEEERDRLRRFDLTDRVHLDRDRGGWMLYDGGDRVAWFADLRHFVADVLCPGTGARRAVHALAEGADEIGHVAELLHSDEVRREIAEQRDRYRAALGVAAFDLGCDASGRPVWLHRCHGEALRGRWMLYAGGAQHTAALSLGSAIHEARRAGCAQERLDIVWQALAAPADVADDERTGDRP